MKYLLILVLNFIFFSCNKANESKFSDCDEKMITKFKAEVTCPYNSNMATYLGKGVYQGELVYFIDIVCANCNTVAPQKVYNCNEREIAVTDFYNSVTNRVRVDACDN